jgi:uncharacterized membrane protein
MDRFARFNPTPDKAFLWLACAAGLAFLVLTPPLQVADENRHLMRSYMIAHGDLGATRELGLPGNPVPRSLERMDKRLGSRVAFHPEVRQDPARWRAEFRYALRPEDTVFVRLPSEYSPVAYTPQALAILALDPFDPPPVVLLYAARLLNLVIWIALVHAALRIAPSHRWVLALLALTPMSLSLAGSSSADTLTNGLSFLLVAVILYWRVAEKPVTAGSALGLWLLATAVGQCKLVYWPLALLTLLIPGIRFGRRRRRTAILAVVLAGSLLPALLWYGYIAGLKVPPKETWQNPEGQLLFLRSDPLAFLSAVWVAITDYSVVWVQGFVGILGWLDTRLPDPVYFVYPVVLLAAALYARPVPGGLRLGDRGLLLAVAGISWLAAMFVCYVYWTHVGSVAVAGFQGRYLIPVAPLVLIALGRQRGRGLPRWARLAAVAVSAGTLAVGIGTVLYRYHLGP